jgi:hypothetical protein
MSPDIAIIFNCEIRNNGTAGYFHRAGKILEAEGACRIKHYMPRGELLRHDWYLYIDDGRDDLRWQPPHPCAYYAIDTHLGYGYRVWKARHFDRVFTAQKDAVEKMKRDGIEKVQWLPLACHPEAHLCAEELVAKGIDPKFLEQTTDVAFVGFLNEGDNGAGNNRIDYLERLYREFPNSWVTIGAFFEDMSIRYARSRIGFNVSIKNDLNMRVFEVMSTGTALLTDGTAAGISDLFTPHVHYIPYEGIEDMVKQCGDWLNRPEELKRIAAAGFTEVRAKHTYKHRMEAIMEVMSHA